MTHLRKIIDTIVVVAFMLLSSIISIISFKNFKNDPLYIEKEFVVTFEEFKNDAKKYEVIPEFSGLTTTFIDDAENGVLGYCIPAFNTVKISKKKWNTLSDLRKKLLLYHEWGHCTLLRDHVESDNLACPLSIMHPYINPTASCYPSLKEWYDRELFTNPYKTDLIKKENYEATSTTNATNY
jgi:hypothetical protein